MKESRHDAGRKWRSLWLPSITLYLVALALRLIFIHQSHILPDFHTPTPGLDICLHWEGAQHIRAGTPDPCFELMPPSAPGHPYFVAFSQILFGESLLTHRVFRAFLGSFSPVLVFLLAYHLCRHRVFSFLAGLFAATLPSWIYFDTMLIKVSVEIVLLCLVLWIALRVKLQAALARVLGLGLLMGILLALLRFSQGGTILYVFILTLFFLFRRTGAPWKARALAVIPMIVLVFGSQLAFKHRDALFGIEKTRFLPVSGVHIRIGFQKGAIGTYHVLRRFPALPLGHTMFSRMAAEAKAGEPLSPAEANRTYISEAGDFIHNNPAESVKIVFRKAGIFFNNFEPGGNHFLNHIKGRVGILNLPTVGYGGLMILAFWGAVWLWQSGLRAEFGLFCGLAGAVLLSNLVAFVSWRYRLHATVPFAVLCGPGLLFLRDRFRTIKDPRTARRARVRLLLVPVVITVALAWLAYRTVLPNARNAMTLTAEKNRALSEKAVELQKKVGALSAQPTLDMKERLQRSGLNHALGRYTVSYNDVVALVEQDPRFIPGTRQYLVYRIWFGDYEGVTDFMADLYKEHPRTTAALVDAFESQSPFWNHSDPNLRLIVQAIMRDIILPRVRAKVGVPEKPVSARE